MKQNSDPLAEITHSLQEIAGQLNTQPERDEEADKMEMLIGHLSELTQAARMMRNI